MNDIPYLYKLIPLILPFKCMHALFMQKALCGLILLSPMSAVMGVHVVNSRMAFFSDAISHSVFTGVALGIIFSIDPNYSTMIFGVLVGLSIMAFKRQSSLSSDTVIGVFFSAAVAFGIAIISRYPNLIRNTQTFLYGDILTIDSFEINALIFLFFIVMLFQFLGYNRLIYIGFSPILAEAHQIKVKLYQYIFAALLSIVVIFSVWLVGVFLVTALLILPSAASRNFAHSAGGMLWWAVFISLTSSVTGLIISAQDWARTATGATVILIVFAWFLASYIFLFIIKKIPPP